ncbi:P-loop NTPase [Bradyrhizobium erythrophlei]|uniref:P-loop NTPase n=1 Tax=Bradyrhizobium erythrophlei TaxID=1437360 RepID=UPI0035EA0BD6
MALASRQHRAGSDADDTWPINPGNRGLRRGADWRGNVSIERASGQYASSPPEARALGLFGHGGARHEAERLGVPSPGEIPLDIAIRTSSDSGQPMVEGEPDGLHAAIYRAIGGKVREQLQGVIAAA